MAMKITLLLTLMGTLLTAIRLTRVSSPTSETLPQ